MALHPRQLIRVAAVAQLVGKTAAQDRVFKTKVTPWKQQQMPGIAVYTLEEDNTPRLPDLDRDLTLSILGVVEHRDDVDVDDELDALALEIEDAVNADPTIGGTATLTFLSNTKIDLVDEQGRPVGAVRLNFTAKYRTSRRKL